MAVEILLAIALALGGGGNDPRQSSEKLKEKDQLIAALIDLQRRVRNGELPSEKELALSRATRERILSGLDFHKAKGLGLEVKALRNRLVPGFSAELDQLVKRQETHDLAPGEDPSPILTLVLDVEQQLFAAADRRRQRVGIKSPLDSGPLSQKLEAPAPTTPPDARPDSTAVATATVPAIPSHVDGATRGADPKAVGKALYRAGRYADAVKAWERANFDDPATSLELAYMFADALFRSGRPEDAIVKWEKLAADHADTSFGQQADFALKIARTMVALKEARGDEKDVERTGAKPDAGAAKPEGAKPRPEAPADPKKTGGKHGP